MLKAAIEKIESMVRPMMATVKGHEFLLMKDGAAEIHPDVDLPDVVDLNSLDALISMIQKEAVNLFPGERIFVSVRSHNQVEAFLSPKETTRWKRPQLYRATAKDVPGWEASAQMGFENAIIALQTRFQQSTDFEYTMQLLSQITTGGKMTFNDNGVATTITTQKGVSLAANMTIKPIVTLRPYRTFHEVEQPDGLFLIRISERGITFTEADGGMWKLNARKTVKAFLQKNLVKEIEDGRVVVMM